MGGSSQAAACRSQRGDDSLLGRLGAALSGRVVIASIGNPMRGDDALGPALVERLRGRVEAILIDCAEVPERYLGAIAAPAPDSVLLVDAVDMGAAPGSVAVLGQDELPDRLGTTHNTPLKVLVRYLAAETGARVTLLAVQPATLTLEAPMSSEVEATLDALADLIAVIVSGAEGLAAHHRCDPPRPAQDDSQRMVR